MFLALSRIICLKIVQQKHSFQKVYTYIKILQKCLLPCILMTYPMLRKELRDTWSCNTLFRLGKSPKLPPHWEFQVCCNILWVGVINLENYKNMITLVMDISMFKNKIDSPAPPFTIHWGRYKPTSGELLLFMGQRGSQTNVYLLIE